MIDFPDMFQNEILVSAIARFQAITLNYSLAATTTKLFGKRLFNIGIGLPSHLMSFSNSVGRKTFDELLNDHTLWPYYATFLDQQRRDLCYKELLADGRVNFHTRDGSLKYCPICLSKNSEKEWKRYWERLHQIPGLIICPTHKCNLLEATSSTFRLKDANEVVILPSDIRVNDSPILCELASLQNDFLLKSTSVRIDRYDFRQKIILQQKIRAKIEEDFRVFYAESNLLNMIGENTGAPWIANFLRNPARYQDPIKQILFYHYFESAGATRFVVDNPFGRGPWECINNASDHFGRRVVEQYEQDLEPKSRRVIYKFSCGCGMAYTASILQKNGKPFVIRKVKKYGNVWFQRVERDLNQGLSISEIARSLRSSTATISKHSKLLTLLKKADFVDDSLEKKLQWIELLSVTELKVLKKEKVGLYRYLFRMDRQWLSVVNRIIKPNGNSQQLAMTFKVRELNIMEIVKQVSNILKESSRVRVTKGLINFLIIGLQRGPMENLKPLSSIFSELEESQDEFQQRLVINTCRTYLLDRNKIDKWKVMQKAGIRKPRENAIEALQSMIG